MDDVDVVDLVDGEASIRKFKALISLPQRVGFRFFCSLSEAPGGDERIWKP
ncbi:MAG: hypothetical protein GY859_10135 [Desulfobacterales bacterium]|nr:hypothetical protein [Desulfobacterales bacterium]